MELKGPLLLANNPLISYPVLQYLTEYVQLIRFDSIISFNLIYTNLKMDSL